MKDEYGGTCAMAAAAEAIGYRFPEPSASEIEAKHREPLSFISPYDRRARLNAAFTVPQKVWEEIVYMNDVRRLSRQQIADWIEQTYEKEQVPCGAENAVGV